MVQKNIETVGERLRKRREEIGLSPEELAREIQAPIKYVHALESDLYEIFPAKVYGLGFFKKTLATLAYEDTKSALEEFANEWDIRMFRKKKELTPLPGKRNEATLITPARAGSAVAAILVLFSIVFFGTRLLKFIGTPTLLIEEPRNEAAYSDLVVLVRGKTEKESQLTVNGRELKIDESGFFTEEIELGAGVHSLEFAVENRFGKIKKRVRDIIIK